MRFPVNVTDQKRCPVCKTAGPGTHPPTTPRPETATLTFGPLFDGRGLGGAVCLGVDVSLGWDSGVSASPRSRASLGAHLFAAKREGDDPDYRGGLSIEFCSTRCLRRFLTAAVDELERRAAAVGPRVKSARAQPGRGIKARRTRRCT